MEYPITLSFKTKDNEVTLTNSDDSDYSRTRRWVKYFINGMCGMGYEKSNVLESMEHEVQKYNDYKKSEAKRPSLLVQSFTAYLADLPNGTLVYMNYKKYITNNNNMIEMETENSPAYEIVSMLTDTDGRKQIVLNVLNKELHEKIFLNIKNISMP